MIVDSEAFPLNLDAKFRNVLLPFEPNSESNRTKSSWIGLLKRVYLPLEQSQTSRNFADTRKIGTTWGGTPITPTGLH